MHELSLAHSVVQVLEEEARRHGVRRISRVRLRVGSLRAVVPELLETAMGFASQGSVAEGAVVELEQVQGLARCSRCGAEFSVVELFFVCPECAAPGGQVLCGQELQVVEFEGE